MESYPKEKTELARYLAGYPEYAILNRYGNTPTDSELVLRPILETIQDDPAFLATLHSALVILSEDKQYGWMTMYYIFDLAWKEKRLQLSLLPPTLVATIGKALQSNQDSFAQVTQFKGGEYANGVWNDILRMNTNIFEEFGITVLPASALGSLQ